MQGFLINLLNDIHEELEEAKHEEVAWTTGACVKGGGKEGSA